MRKFIVAAAAGFALLLGACNGNSLDEVVERLEENLEEASSYGAQGILTIDQGGQRLEAEVEVSFAQPDFYRISLRPAGTDSEEIILKNQDGIFVLKPVQGKLLEFQSWPSSQIYLYQSLLADISLNEDSKMTREGGAYVFSRTVEAPSGTVDSQIRFCQERLIPLSATATSTHGEALVEMSFTGFEFDVPFEASHFDTENVIRESISEWSQSVLSIPRLANSSFFPAALPDGVDLVDQSVIPLPDGERIIMTFGGESEFTLIQETRQRDSWLNIPVSGELIFIEGTVGSLRDNSLTWTEGGIEFSIFSNTLDAEELIAVASSVRSLPEK